MACGGGSDFKDRARPPVPLQLNGVITASRVTVSPNKVGAGPVVMHRLEPDADLPHPHARRRQHRPGAVGPINPLDTGQIQQTLQPGQYTVKAGSAEAVTREIAPAHLIIGKARPNSNDQVELP